MGNQAPTLTNRDAEGETTLGSDIRRNSVRQSCPCTEMPSMMYLRANGRKRVYPVHMRRNTRLEISERHLTGRSRPPHPPSAACPPCTPDRGCSPYISRACVSPQSDALLPGVDDRHPEYLDTGDGRFHSVHFLGVAGTCQGARANKAKGRTRVSIFEQADLGAGLVSSFRETSQQYTEGIPA